MPVSTRPTALITGIAGQDGSYLAEQLVANGYRVCGIVRSLQSTPRAHIAHLANRVELLEGDVDYPETIRAALAASRPNEVYHLAGQSFAAGWSADGQLVERSRSTCECLLREVALLSPTAHVILACSSEAFGVPTESPQNEETALAPVTPYGRAKADLLKAAREARGRGERVSAAILYNHESPRRSPRFVSRKVTLAAAGVALGRQRELVLGNLDARRDWGWAPEYADALWRVGRSDVATDFVIGSGRSRTVRELTELAFRAVGLDAREFVRTDPALVRPVDVTTLVADPSKARALLGWRAVRTLEEIVAEMVAADLQRLKGAPL